MKDNKTGWEKFNDWQGSGCVWLVVLFIAASIYSRSCSGGSELPLNVQNENLGNPTIELAGDGPDYDPNQSHMETAAADALRWKAEDEANAMERQANSAYTSSGCPSGCYAPSSGCTIKGNKSINTGEKIYHMPGDPYYNDTNISPQYGERWFCTEEEARANGWRRAAH